MCIPASPGTIFTTAALVLAAAPAAAHGQQPPTPFTATQQAGVAVYTSPPATVIQALTSLLQERGEMAAEALPELQTALLSDLESRNRAQANSQESVVDRAQLEGLVTQAARSFVRDDGGRYLVSFTVEPDAAGGTRVTVVPVIIGAVPASDGPLGGRVLPSNGSLEQTLLTALAARLPG